MKALLKSSFTVSAMTVTSRITGFLRDLVFANVFGVSAGFDAFQMAFRITNVLRRLFAEGAFSQAFVPVLSEYKQNRPEDDVREFVSQMARTMFLTLFGITVIAVLITPWLIWILAPGYVHDPTRFDLVVTMLRITFPYLLLISLTALVSGILNTYGLFAVPAFTPNLLNFALIGAAIFMAPHFKQPAVALAWGVFIGGVAQLLFQLPFVAKIRMLPRLSFKKTLRDNGVKRVLRLMGPAVFGVSVAQIGIFVDTLFASFLPIGSISWLYYSDRLTSFPLGVFGVAIATVILPHLAKKHAANSAQEFSETLDWALKLVLTIALPAMLGIILLAKPILTTLFAHGKFTSFDVTMASKSLIGFAFGVPAFMLVKVLASGFYSKQNIKTPVKIAITAIVTNIILDALLIFPLKHAGLALATSLASSLNAGLLCWTLLKHKIYMPSTPWKKFILQLLFANVALALALYFTNLDFNTWLKFTNFTRVWHLALSCGLAITLYLACLWISGLRVKDFAK